MLSDCTAMPIQSVNFEGRPQRLLAFQDPVSRASGLIAIDSTALGPATGGCRLWPYDDDDAMLRDVQRLARGMSYKNAIAGLPLGGGKSVIRRPSGDFDRVALFRALGRALDELGGDYLVAEDVGTTTRDMQIARSVSPYVFGLTVNVGSAGGDPSPWTALGVFLSIEILLGRRGRSVAGSRIAVQGLGSVGADLCRRLHAAGASLVVADVNERAVAELLATVPAEIATPGSIHGIEADVFAPCALGAGLNGTTIPEIRACIVAGAANNQLATPADADLLHRRGILYGPDYVVNAGGIINVAAEYLGLTTGDVADQVARIGPRLSALLDRAEAERITPSIAADATARDILASASKGRSGLP
ncbi:leucine dehydrogenase [Methylobacterium sp. ap11]|uniref:Leu/Phe/Val dehydrogenase n=1 Tax=Methylobacterium sp. ap11 TaxID=1761799 RepID=UPI0008C29AA9|nr:Glu/Leu/Phe/Val dehydrogenase dimerization domain-containing protein [Methylobacterium sp. ap11]SEP48153.1 leucine dehydrogenase [Methylobacterium sp. ap11]